MDLFLRYLWENPRLFFSAAVIVCFSICCHEFMHAFAALKFGDDTAANRGHLTLNPLRQMGVVSLIMFCLVGIAWGQVPVDLRKLRGRFAPALVALAGPLTNLVIGFLFLAGAFLLVRNFGESFALQMLCYGGILNYLLFILNLLPIPGLDGGAVVQNFLPQLNWDRAEWSKGVLFFLILALFAGFDYLWGAAEFLAQQTLSLLARVF